MPRCELATQLERQQDQVLETPFAKLQELIYKLPSMNSLGSHILVEYIGCSAEVLNDVALIENAMVDAANAAGATVIQSSFHHFSPWGVSGVVVIQESHLAIHTWPEYRYAAVDLFTCGDSVDPWICFQHLKEVFQSTGQSALEMSRGSLHLVKKDGATVADLAAERASFPPPAGADARNPQVPKFQRSIWFTDKDENQALSLRHTGEVLFDVRSPFQKVRVLQSVAYGKMLAIDNMVMCTERDEFHYHEMLVHPALQSHPSPKDVLIIGGGDGGTLREVLRYPQVQKATMVEIDEQVLRASREHFPGMAEAFSHSKAKVIVGDGIEFVAKAANASFDLVIVDGSDPEGPAQGLFSREFYANCHRILRADGICVTQSESPMFQTDAFVALHKCFTSVFGAEKTHKYLFFAPTYPTGMWSVQMGRKGELHPIADFRDQTADAFSQEHKLRYYNSGVHRGAFSLPTYVSSLLKV